MSTKNVVSPLRPASGSIPRSPSATAASPASGTTSRPHPAHTISGSSRTKIDIHMPLKCSAPASTFHAATRTRMRPSAWSVEASLTTFYEKVVKVKADVAAILKSFLPMPQIEADITTQPRGYPSGGCARGVSAERFETPLAGGAAASMRASAFCWRAACQRLGGNPPAPAFPRRGKRERGCSDFLVAAGSSRWHSANVGHAAGLLCARSSSMFVSITITKPMVDPLVPLSQKSCWRHPLLCRASIRTLMGRIGPGACWGPISSPGPSPP